jgi:hypothetical protein
METNNPTVGNTIESDFARMSAVRQEFGDYSCQLAQLLERGELENAEQSGALELRQQIQDLSQTGTQLKSGIFRLLVMGDVKRGKSTFVNVLLGESLLPMDVTPCTAVLTILRYGAGKNATVHRKKRKNTRRSSARPFRM